MHSSHALVLVFAFCAALRPAAAAVIPLANRTITGTLPISADDTGTLSGTITLDGGVISVDGKLQTLQAATTISGDGSILLNGPLPIASWNYVGPRSNPLLIDANVEVLGGPKTHFSTENTLLRGLMTTQGVGNNAAPFRINAFGFTNEGILEARSGGFLWIDLDPGSTTRPSSHNLAGGTIRTAAGGTVRLGSAIGGTGKWTGPLSDLGTFENTGRIEINFPLDNVGRTTTFDGGEWVLLGELRGRVTGGVLDATPSTTLAIEPYRAGSFTDSNPMVFDGVAFDADLTSRPSSIARIENSAVINGDWSIAGGSVVLKGSPIISGGGRFLFQQSSGSLSAEGSVATLPATMTLRAEAGGSAALQKTGGIAGNAWLVDAAVEADGGEIILGSSAIVTNNGVATARNAGVLRTSNVRTINNGTLRAELGGGIEFREVVENNGSVEIDGGVLLYNGITPSGPGSFTVANSRIYANKSGQTLAELKALQGGSNQVVVGTAPVNLGGGVLTLADADGSRWAIHNASFTNGTVESADGFALTIVGPSPGSKVASAPLLRGFTLNADVRIGAGRMAALDSTLAGDGRFVLDGGTLELRGGYFGANAVNVADVVDRIDVDSGGVVRFSNEMNNTGRTLRLKAGATWELVVTRASGISGGRIEADPGVELRHVQGYGYGVADLRGVTLAASVRVLSSRQLYIRDGLTLDGGVVEIGEGIGNQFSDARVVFLGVQTLDGSGEVRFNAIPGFPSHPTFPRVNMLQIGGSGAEPAGLTIGENLTVRTAAGSGYIGGAYFYQLPPAAATLVNHGTLLAENGHSLTIFAGTFLQEGTLRAAAGSRVIVQQAAGANDGLIDLGGGTFAAVGATYANGLTGEIRGQGRLDFAETAFTNSGLIVPTDAIDLNGDFTQASTGMLQLGVTSDQALTFDSLRIDGAAALDGTLRLDFTGPDAPELGDSWPLLTAAGGVIGAFRSIVADWLPHDARLVIDYEATAVTATLAERVAGDFNGDGAVDGRDLLAWQRGDSPQPQSAADLAHWNANYGVRLPVGAAGSLVPEPASLATAIMAIAVALVRVKRRHSQSQPPA
jgi:hypothetical protein